jgi:glycosyltransferase involved in cell wall biosynthesis
MPGIDILRYKPHRQIGKEQHPYLRKMEDAVLHGQAVAKLLDQLRQQGFVPDAIVAHPGWGETLYAKDIFPSARLIHLSEWFYGQPGSDIGFDPEFPSNPDGMLRLRTWNALHLLNLQNCDVGVCPTAWQRQQHPAIWQPRLTLAHEGVDVERLHPNPHARFALPNGPELKPGDPVITYVARNLEPYRGFHIFMRALQYIQQQHPTCHALVLGGDEVSYGAPPKGASHWREAMLRECTLDLSRVHFLGRVPRPTYARALQVSAAHIYLSYPFVLSWSMLEAMASACLVIGSQTAPVLEVLQDGINGLTVDFFSPREIADKALQALARPGDFEALRQRARADVRASYRHEEGVQRYESLLYPMGYPAHTDAE